MYLGVELLGQMVTLCGLLRNLWTVFQCSGAMFLCYYSFWLLKNSFYSEFLCNDFR